LNKRHPATPMQTRPLAAALPQCTTRGCRLSAYHMGAAARLAHFKSPNPWLQQLLPLLLPSCHSAARLLQLRPHIRGLTSISLQGAAQAFVRQHLWVQYPGQNLPSCQCDLTGCSCAQFLGTMFLKTKPATQPPQLFRMNVPPAVLGGTSSVYCITSCRLCAAFVTENGPRPAASTSVCVKL
jgi:hypothetical protein